MNTTSKLVTAEELLAMGSNAKWLELHDGELRNVSPANFQHGSVAVQIASLLNHFVKSRKLSAILVETGFVLARNPDTVLGPDVAFIKAARIPDENLREKFVEGFPDLAIEIISPGNPRSEREEKMRTFIKHGTPLGWLIDPRKQSVEIYRPTQLPHKLGNESAISGEDILPGYSVSIADFFA